MAWRSWEQVQTDGKRGLEIYNTQLKKKLEPKYNGYILAINIATGDYVLGKTNEEVEALMKERFLSPKLRRRKSLPLDQRPNIFKLRVGYISMGSLGMMGTFHAVR